MGRPERPIGPSDGLVGRFAEDLRNLRKDAGNPSYRKMARRSHYSRSTLSLAAHGTRLPSLPVTLRYVRACGGDVEVWERRWQELSAALRWGSLVEAPPRRTVGAIAAAPAVPSDSDFIPLPGGEPAVQPVGVGRPLTAVGRLLNDPPKRFSSQARRGMVPVALATAASLGAVTVWALTTGNGPEREGPPLPVAEGTAHAPAVGPTITVTASPRTTAEGVASSMGKGPGVKQKGGGAKDVGGSSGSGSGSGSISTGSIGSPSTPKGVLAGPGCPSTEANKTGTFTPGDGFHSASGGWSENGCNGTVEYTDLTGSPTHWEDDFDWAFTVRKGAHCRFTVYIPNTSRAGAVAPYDVYGPDQSATGYRIATFSIDQRTHHGSWVSSPSYTFPDGVAQVQLVDRGTPGSATVAASATVISCS